MVKTSRRYVIESKKRQYFDPAWGWKSRLKGRSPAEAVKKLFNSAIDQPVQKRVVQQRSDMKDTKPQLGAAWENELRIRQPRNYNVERRRHLKKGGKKPKPHSFVPKTGPHAGERLTFEFYRHAKRVKP